MARVPERRRGRSDDDLRRDRWDDEQEWARRRESSLASATEREQIRYGCSPPREGAPTVGLRLVKQS